MQIVVLRSSAVVAMVENTHTLASPNLQVVHTQQSILFIQYYLPAELAL